MLCYVYVSLDDGGTRQSTFDVSQSEIRRVANWMIDGQNKTAVEQWPILSRATEQRIGHS